MAKEFLTRHMQLLERDGNQKVVPPACEGHLPEQIAKALNRSEESTKDFAKRIR